MKKVVLSICAITMLSNSVFAGGDMKKVEPAVEPVIMVPEAIEDNGFYFGLGYGYMGEEYTRSENGIVDTARSFDEDFSSVMLQVGYKVNSYIALEGRYWFDVDDVTIAAYNGTVDAPDAWGIYIKPMYPVTDSFDIYGLVGYANIDTLNKLDDFSWGLGASYSFTDNVSMFLDYVSLHNDDRDFTNTTGATITKEYVIDTVNIGVTYNF